MKLPFFRKPPALDDVTVVGEASLDDALDEWAHYEAPIEAPPMPDADPVRKAAYGRIGLVTIDERSQLPALLTDVTPSALMHRIKLPRNPRIATDELYELDSMDYILMLSDDDQHFTRDMARWIRRLKHLRIPLLVLLPVALTDRRDQQRKAQFEQMVGVPVIDIGLDDIEQARQQFLATTMDLMPAMGLALGAHLPTFRQPLIDTLRQNAASDSLVTRDTANIQWQMIRQMCAAHGIHGSKFEEHRAALETLMRVVEHYGSAAARRIPTKDDAHQSRLTAAVTTLLLGHATAVYLGAEPPSLRKQLVPQLWRLYRASRQPLST